MPVITPKTLAELAEHRGDLSISMFLPTHRSGPEVDQDRIRLKNATSSVRDRLSERGLRRPEIDRILEPAAARLDDHDFWQHSTEGLAIFLSPETNRTLRLPISPTEMTLVGDRFHLIPLVPALQRGPFLLLAFSRGSVRLFEVTRSDITEIELDAPRSIDDSDWFMDREAQLQHHATDAGGERASFHGHDPHDRDAEDLRRFLSAVASATKPHVSKPLVLATVDELRSAYEKVARHPVADTHIPGNPDRLSPPELQRRAVEVIERRLEQQEQRRIETLQEAVGAGRAAIGVEAAIGAAEEGRVSEILVDRDVAPWDGGTEEPADIDMPTLQRLDDAVVATLRHGGDAWMVSGLPGGEPVGAILRY